MRLSFGLPGSLRKVSTIRTQKTVHQEHQQGGSHDPESILDVDSDQYQIVLDHAHTQLDFTRPDVLAGATFNCDGDHIIASGDPRFYTDAVADRAHLQSWCHIAYHGSLDIRGQPRQ